MTATTATKPADCEHNSRASIAVIEALEQDSGINPHDSEFRLYDLIDPDALNTLFSCQQTTDLSIEFDIDNVTVSISKVDDTFRCTSRTLSNRHSRCRSHNRL